MEDIVALDIETTGLDPTQDAILEIGCVRFHDHRVVDEWSTLIHPGRRIPPFITQLTGITDQMVLQAPSIREVLPELERFTGNAPILGHNIRFDLSFLNKVGILQHNTSVDTYEMAAVLLPNAGRYNLGALANTLGVPYPATHRALEDARATRGVFLRLYEEVMHLPLPILAEILRLSESVDWGGSWSFKMAMRERSKEIISPASIRHGYQGPIFEERPVRISPPLQPLEELIPLDPEETASVIEPGGVFAQHFPQYEYRSQQVEMLRAIATALSEGQHLMVEAGTGIGKSMAYLIPAAFWAIRNSCRVVISTNTINLQDQLINKDIPDLRNALGVDLQAAVLKGRSNYLCPRRLENFRKHGIETVEDLRVLAKVLVWLQGTQTGDRAEINLNGPIERQIWARLSAEDEGCTTENCVRRTGAICPFYRAHQAAQYAHLLVVNHALLLADLATGNRVLPEFDYLIIDEGHHLESATTDAMSYSVTSHDIERQLRQLGGPNSGLLGWSIGATQEIIQPADLAALKALVQKTADIAFRFQNENQQFFSSLNQFINEQQEGKPATSYAHQERILPATRTQPSWERVEMAWEEADLSLKPLLEAMAQLITGIAEIHDSIGEENEELHSSLAALYRQLDVFRDEMNAIVFEPSHERIYWAEIQANGYQLSLHAAPLHIGRMMEEFLWHTKTSIILTSATLTAAGDFNYLRGRLNAEDAGDLALGSPFDYENAALLYLVNDIPEPTDRNGHQRGVENILIRLCRAVGGRTLVLFTSYDQLKRTSQAISPVLSRDEIVIFEQGEGASPHTLLETFRSTERSVLLGTRSFWEGVDIPGQALSVLVIVKLPFDVPSDPIIAARSETFEDPFQEYALPEAILRFRQGFGRLIRSQSDHGIVAVLDRRILTKRYGRLFLDSLPDCTVKSGPAADLPQAASKWLNI